MSSDPRSCIFCDTSRALAIVTAAMGREPEETTRSLCRGAALMAAYGIEAIERMCEKCSLHFTLASASVIQTESNPN